MADVLTDAVSQEAIADTLVSDPPEQQTQATEAVGTEQQEFVEGGEQQLEAEQQFETEAENAEDWLPTEQDKIFSDDVLLQYAQRYQKDAEWLSDPLNRQLLTDKLNTDIYLRQQQEYQEQQEFEVEQPEPTQQAPQQLPSFDEYINGLRQTAAQFTDPQIAQTFANEFLSAFGVKEAATPQVAQALTHAMTTYGLNLIQTALPQMLAPMLDQVMPGFGDMYYMSARASAWDQVRNSGEQFSNLPAYGSKEMIALCQKLDGEYDGLRAMGEALEKTNGGQLHGPAAVKFYTTLAKLATRQQVDPQLLAQAAQAGAKTARRGEVRRQAGQLGAGRSTSGTQRPSPSSKFQTNTDIFDDETMATLERYGRA